LQAMAAKVSLARQALGPCWTPCRADEKRLTLVATLAVLCPCGHLR
jgi:hypothetical protein